MEINGNGNGKLFTWVYGVEQSPDVTSLQTKKEVIKWKNGCKMNGYIFQIRYFLCSLVHLVRDGTMGQAKCNQVVRVPLGH